MAWSSRVILSLIELIAYLGLAPIAAFTLFKHRSPSLYGHIFLYAFIILRITSDSLTILHRDDTANMNTTGAIINSIGLSPLLLATSGFVHEARHYIANHAKDKSAKKMGFIFEMLVHILVVTGVALLATGSSKAAEATTPADAQNNRHLSYVGSVLLLVSWIVILTRACLLMRTSNVQKRAEFYQPLPRLLLTEILVSLPFTGVRVAYTIVYTFDRSPSLNPTTASFVVYFFLLFLSQLIATTVLMLALVFTRNIARNTIDSRIYEHDLATSGK